MRIRRKRVSDQEVFDAVVRVMMRVGPNELTLAAIAADAGLTAGALVQRFGSKRNLMLAHANYAAATSDIGVAGASVRRGSALNALRATVNPFAELAASPAAGLRNLAYLQRDLADPNLYKNLLKINQKARKHYEELILAAVTARELRQETPIKSLARTLETTLIGSFVAWLIYREGPAAKWLRRDLDAVLQSYLEGSLARIGTLARRGVRK